MTHTGWRTVSDFLRTRVDRGDVPAVVAAAADGNGFLYLEGFGKRDVANNADATADTIFRLASMTKPVTSLAAMMLVENGRIALEDPVTKHLAD
jgi:CubicO group peptidase (beta-lactamase class C family)